MLSDGDLSDADPTVAMTTFGNIDEKKMDKNLMLAPLMRILKRGFE